MKRLYSGGESDSNKVSITYNSRLVSVSLVSGMYTLLFSFLVLSSYRGERVLEHCMSPTRGSASASVAFGGDPDAGGLVL